MKNNHPAAGLEFENENMHPVDRLVAENKRLIDKIWKLEYAKYDAALQEATDALEWYVNQHNGSHAATRLNNIADIMGWERKR